MIELHHIDCMEFLRGQPDKAFDLAIVDPPYGIDASKMKMGSGKHGWKDGKDWDGSIPGHDYWMELFRVSQNQIVWGGNYMTEFLPPSQHWIVWDKNNPNLSFAEGELAWVRNGNNLRIFKHYSARPDGTKIHPTQKPVALYRWLLKNYAKPGQRILDTHLGSGSIAIACDIEGFDLVGCELDGDYIAAARKRLAEHQAQPRLFDTPKPSSEQLSLDAA